MRAIQRYQQDTLGSTPSEHVYTLTSTGAISAFTGNSDCRGKRLRCLAHTKNLHRATKNCLLKGLPYSLCCARATGPSWTSPCRRPLFLMVRLAEDVPKVSIFNEPEGVHTLDKGGNSVVPFATITSRRRLLPASMALRCEFRSKESIRRRSELRSLQRRTGSVTISVITVPSLR
ncbi:hypothetical protein BDZ89DRAFT_752104 [Hymenopellis radicata]|nr:hypothetical protein BDZ89DRAFT_752104 [Hymenopellis radicata]